VHINIKNIVKNNAARFSFYRAGYMYYEVAVDGHLYRFPVSLETWERRLSWQNTKRLF
jgi:hypothetical protein